MEVRSNPALDAQQRELALKAIQEQTLQVITEILGPEAARAYYRQGSWIRNLSEN